MNILVACEVSGAVRDAFRAHGHEAWSNDLEGNEPRGKYPNYHLAGDVRWFLDQPAPGGAPWDVLIAFPPCTYLCVSGLHWNKRRPARALETEAALAFALELAHAPIPRIAIENPVGCLSTRWRKPDQIIQPWQFGDDASKATCLWLKNLPALTHTNVLPGGRTARRANQTASGQNKLGPSPERAALRAVTYPGIANAMAAQLSSAAHVCIVRVLHRSRRRVCAVVLSTVARRRSRGARAAGA